MLQTPARLFFILLCLALLPFAGFAQSVAELERKLDKSQSKTEKMNLCYQIAEKLIGSNANKAADYAHRASLLASELGEKRREAEAIFLSADALARARKGTDAAARFNWAWNTARNYGLRDIALNAAEKLQELARKEGNTKEEIKWAKETIAYLKENTGRGTSSGDANNKLSARIGALESENARLGEELARLQGNNQMQANNTKLSEEQQKQASEKIQAELTKRDQAITDIAKQKLRSDSLVRTKVRMLANMTQEQMADSMLLAQQERQLQIQQTRLTEAELRDEKQKNIQYLMGGLSGIAIILAGAFYARFRAKRRAADELTQKNTIIEGEQKKSDALLLNILPPAIAQELKAKNKVAARKYDQATVMFIDFTGFTHVSERLSPEALVDELDYCFSNFDRIISKYRIEKIKTVGDAYICASGLSDMNASPSDMVKAALEIQDFLQSLKAERLTRALPYFDARCGIHTGPVVAGVVGAKKFAYDIWGDTVNIAARMEETCEPGRVNVSETTHDLAKYEFEWHNRGRVAAKNKGMMEMYYVTSAKSY
jgi:adenylate cyclase